MTITLYLFFRASQRGEDIITRRTLEGAEKWALRVVRREEETLGLRALLVSLLPNSPPMESAANSQALPFLRSLHQNLLKLHDMTNELVYQ